MEVNEEKILEKVQKLLALAGSDNEAEAQAAAAKAQELITRYNLDVQQLGKKSGYIHEGLAQYLTVPDHAKYVATILVDFFFVQVVNTQTSIRKGPFFLSILGTRPNVENAKHIYAYLVDVYKRLWRETKQRERLHHMFKNSYYTGLTMGLAAKLREARETVQTEMGLVVVPDEELLKFTHEEYDNGLRVEDTEMEVKDRDIFSLGMRDGSKINIQRGLESETRPSGKFIGA